MPAGKNPMRQGQGGSVLTANIVKQKSTNHFIAVVLWHKLYLFIAESFIRS